jgi:type I restriction enzyme S subunit
VRLVPIGECVEKASSWNPVRDAPDETIAYVDLGAIDNEHKVIREPQSVLGRDAPSRARQKLNAGDILVSTVRPYLNGVAKVPEWLAGSTGSTGFCVLRPSSTKIDRSYLFQWLTASPFINDMVRKSTGASYPAVSDRIIHESLIPLPSLPEQIRIAAILDQADEVRRLRRKALARLADLGQAIFFEMFGDPSRNPLGWDKVPLVDCVAEKDDIRCGPFGTQLLKEEFRHEGVPLWGIKQVNRGFLVMTEEFVSKQKAQELRNYDILPGDIVMTRKGTVGNCSVYPDGYVPGIMHSDLLRVRRRGQIRGAWASAN